MPIILDGTNGETFPSWTTATRPASPAVGQMGYNTTTGAFDAYTAAGWVSVATSATAPVNGPAFSAYLAGGSQSITGGTETVAILDTKEFDTAGCFNNTGSTVTLNGLSVPAYAFCPNVAGYYQVSANLRYGATSTFSACVAYFSKNGGQYYRWFELTTGAWTTGWSTAGSMLMYFNGTGDYVQLTGSVSGGTSLTFQNAGFPYTSRLQAVLARKA